MGIVFDEYEKLNPKAWGVTSPILRANSGWAWFIGTPLGKNHFYDVYVDGVSQLDGEWKSWLLRASTSGIIPQEELDKEKRNHSQDLYNAEYEWKFLEGQGVVFRGVQEIANSVPKSPESGVRYVIGADLAKLRDFTVLTVYDTRDNTQVYQDRFQDLDWPFQKKKIAALSAHYNQALVVLDATGLGDPIADDLLRAGVPVEPIKLGEANKQELVENLRIWIEQKKIRILNIDDTLREFEQFTYTIGETNRVHYGAPSGERFHDDIVISHCLAVWKLIPIYAQSVERPLSAIQAYRKRLETKYDDDNEWKDFEAV